MTGTRLKAFFVKDAWLKILACALALVTWLYIDMELHDQRPSPLRPPAEHPTAIVE